MLYEVLKYVERHTVSPEPNNLVDQSLETSYSPDSILMAAVP